ncbi:MAG: shikimate kinase [Aestuariivita sp.]|nr:shikimate kinase [Aestuariivita sp.]
MGISRLKAEGLILNKTVVFVGMMGAGKSLVGHALAKYLNVEFFDSDAEIESAENTTIQKIFEYDGEVLFRHKERQIIKRLMNRQKPIVLATGGGTFLTSKNRYYISKNGFSIFLNVPVEVLWPRVMNDYSRPLLKENNAFSTLQSLYSERLPFYLGADLEFAIAKNILPNIIIENIVNILIERNIVIYP